MDKKQVIDLSLELKAIARDLSFLSHPRYPLDELLLLFPEHRNFLSHLSDHAHPFSVDGGDKKRKINSLFQKLLMADIPHQLKKTFSNRLNEYETLLHMMENFGKRAFYDGCLKLYGTSDDISLSPHFSNFLKEIQKDLLPEKVSENISAEEGLKYLKIKLSEVFHPDDFEVKYSHSLLSDSSAGRRTLKLNPHKVYSLGQLNIFLVHEGWAHLGTSLNGAYQENNPWLGIWSPKTTSLQEGLALCAELISGHMNAERWNKVVIRHLASAMAERGSSILDVYQFLLHHELNNLDALKLSLRIFRGVPLEGGMAFTKELLYLHGLVTLLLHLSFYKTDLKSLWVGKMSFDEHIMLMDQWAIMDPQLKYFPMELEQPDVLQRLEELKIIAQRIFRSSDKDHPECP